MESFEKMSKMFHRIEQYGLFTDWSEIKIEDMREVWNQNRRYERSMVWVKRL